MIIFPFVSDYISFHTLYAFYVDSSFWEQIIGRTVSTKSYVWRINDSCQKAGGEYISSQPSAFHQSNIEDDQLEIVFL